METLIDKIRCAWLDATEGAWLPGGDLVLGLQSRCGVTRAEPACVIGEAPPGAAFIDEPPGGLPRICEEPGSPPPGYQGPPPPWQATRYPEQDMSSARSAASVGSEMGADEREREKNRLQRLMKDFAKESVMGIAVNLVNTRTGRMPPYFFQMDRRLASFSMRPKDGSSVESLAEDFLMRDIVSIYKGQDVSARLPFLGVDAIACVGLDMNPAERSILLHFDDTYERDKFYTSLRVLKMSMDIQHAR